MAEQRFHCRNVQIPRREAQHGEFHELEVWCFLDPGSPGKYYGKLDERYPERDPQVTELVCTHVDGWPLRDTAEDGPMTAWIERHRPEVEAQIVAAWDEWQDRMAMLDYADPRWEPDREDRGIPSCDHRGA